jgi:hypothetical protein
MEIIPPNPRTLSVNGRAPHVTVEWEYGLKRLMLDCSLMILRKRAYPNLLLRSLFYPVPLPSAHREEVTEGRFSSPAAEQRGLLQQCPACLGISVGLAIGMIGAFCSLITAQNVGYMMSPAVCGDSRLFAAIAGLVNRYAYRVSVRLHPTDNVGM